MSDYYLPRWISYTDYLLQCHQNHTAPDWNTWGQQLLVWEQAWSFNTTMFPTVPSGIAPLANLEAVVQKYLSAPVSSQYVAHVGYDSEEFVPQPDWQLINGSQNHAAVSDDCPWVSKGDGSSVAACQASCEKYGGCNAFNFNSHGQDCEFRHCVDPLHPQLSSGFTGYIVYGNGNAADPQVIVPNAWHTDLSVLAFLCDLTPACQGFNSHGKLTTNATRLVPAAAVTFYSKKSAGFTPILAAVSAGEWPVASGNTSVVTKQVLPAHQPLPLSPLQYAERLRGRNVARTPLVARPSLILIKKN